MRLRYFAGLTIEETATALGLGRTTVKDDWTHARLWLLRAMRDGDDDERDAGRPPMHDVTHILNRALALP